MQPASTSGANGGSNRQLKRWGPIAGVLAVVAIGGGVLLTCLAERITTKDLEALAQGIVTWRKELAPAGDTTCVFRDSAFENDIAKGNLAAILEQYGIANVRSL